MLCLVLSRLVKFLVDSSHPKPERQSQPVLTVLVKPSHLALVRP